MSKTNGPIQLSVHPEAALIPPMAEEEFQALKADIRTHGQREPIWTCAGQIIDGRHRYRACQELGIEPSMREWDGKGSVVAFVVSLNFHRRHLNSSQRAACAVDAERTLAKEAKECMRQGGKTAGRGRPKKGPESVPDPIGNGDARDQAAALFGTSSRYVSDAKRVAEMNPKLLQEVKEGKLTLPQAKRVAQRERRSQEMAEKARLAPRLEPEQARVIHGDCLQELARLKPGTFRLVCPDPRYNLDYGEGVKADLLPEDE